MKKLILSSAVVATVLLTGCQSTGEQYGANVYDASEVNSTQEATTVNIIAVMPAKVKVDNTKGQKNASKAGALLGAIAGGFIGDNSGEAGVGAAIGGIAGGVTGSMVDKEILIDGVSLTYAHDGKTLNAIQVAKACQFKPGIAVMVSTDSGDARLQPNTTCPVEK